MLLQLTVNNFTIIDALTLDFKSGKTVITGETGAGKSIMIDAIELALGKRASSDIIRHGSHRADITLQFDITEIPKAQAMLAEQELDNGLSVDIRRTVNADGRSKSYINQTPVTLQTLRELSDLLINIHSQHEFQTLLNREKQLQLLDYFAGHKDLLFQLEKNYSAFLQSKKMYEELEGKVKDISQREAFLKYQLEELDAIDLGEDEIESINQEFKQLSCADTLIGQSQSAMNFISEDETGSVIEKLHQAMNAVSSILDLVPALKSTHELLNNALIQAEEASGELKYFLSHTEINPERMDYLSERLQKIQDIARKHHIKPEEIVRCHALFREELNQIENSDEYLKILKQSVEEKEKLYLDLAKKISASRKKAAKKMSALVSEQIQTLNMAEGKFDIIFEEGNQSKNGLDKINFMVSLNAGQPFQPLNKVASGGELSRISLAIYVIAADTYKTPVMIFDEVDIGIGGATAEIVGNLLRQLGESTQVICITHLPQVAAKGHHHLLVKKHMKNEKTLASIDYLDEEKRINEIARMLSGEKITPQALAQARELL